MNLLSQSAKTIPPIGIALIVGFIVILVFGIMHDRKKKQRFIKNTAERFEGKVTAKFVSKSCECFVTNEDEIVIKTNGGSEYVVCDIEEIVYAYAGWNMTAKMWEFLLLGENKKSVKGQRFRSTKRKSDKERMGVFCKSHEEAAELCQFAINNIPDIELFEVK